MNACITQTLPFSVYKLPSTPACLRMLFAHGTPCGQASKAKRSPRLKGLQKLMGAAAPPLGTGGSKTSSPTRHTRHTCGENGTILDALYGYIFLGFSCLAYLVSCLFFLLFSMIPHPCSDNAVCAKVPRLRFSGWDCAIPGKREKRLFLLPSHFDSDSASTPSLGRRRSDARNLGRRQCCCAIANGRFFVGFAFRLLLCGLI